MQITHESILESGTPKDIIVTSAGDETLSS